MKHAFALAAAVMAGCTYGPAEDRVTVQNVALSPDAALLAVVVKYERYRQATGLAAFPDGGVPRVLEQRAHVYVVDLRARRQAYRGEMPAPANHRVAFSPWLVGWAGDGVYFKVTGCAGSPGSECYGPLVGTSLFTLLPDGRITPVGASPPLVLNSTQREAGRYVSAGVEPYGVSVSTQPGVPRTPLLRFAGLRLEVVPD
jgi:hypothetical protein